MIDHMTTYATDFDRTKKFYEAVFAPLGFVKVVEMQSTWDPAWPTRHMAAFGPPNKPAFWIAEVKEASSPRHVAFVAKDHAAVDAFYDAAMKSGGKDNGKPGPRPHYHEHFYGAFAFDPDGNNVEAVCHAPVK